jgi:hypothetical protein
MAGRPTCDSMVNPLMRPEEINMPVANSVGILLAPGDSTVVQTKVPGPGIGGSRPQATPGDGLGGAGSLSWWSGARWLSLASLGLVLFW